MKTFVINLEHSVDRKKYIQEILSELEYLDVEFLSAIDGRKFTTEEQNNLFDISRFEKRELRTVKPGEIGCTLSHQKCYQVMKSRDIPYAIILEDDIILKEDLRNYSNKIRKLLNSQEPIVILLSGWFWFDKKNKFDSETIIANVTQANLTHAYAINSAAAKLLIDNRPWYVADDWKLFISKGLKVYGFIPHLIDQDWSGGYESVINHSKVDIISPKLYNKFKLHLRGIRKKILKVRGFEPAERK